MANPGCCCTNDRICREDDAVAALMPLTGLGAGGFTQVLDKYSSGSYVDTYHNGQHYCLVTVFNVRFFGDSETFVCIANGKGSDDAAPGDGVYRRWRTDDENVEAIEVEFEPYTGPVSLTLNASVRAIPARIYINLHGVEREWVVQRDGSTPHLHLQTAEGVLFTPATRSQCIRVEAHVQVAAARAYEIISGTSGVEIPQHIEFTISQGESYTGVDADGCPEICNETYGANWCGDAANGPGSTARTSDPINLGTIADGLRIGPTVSYFDDRGEFNCTFPEFTIVGGLPVSPCTDTDHAFSDGLVVQLGGTPVPSPSSHMYGTAVAAWVSSNQWLGVRNVRYLTSATDRDMLVPIDDEFDVSIDNNGVDLCLYATAQLEARFVESDA